MTNVLELPIEKQKELAQLEGMPFVEWVEATRQEFSADERFRKELDANKGIRPEGMTDSDVGRFQRKIDSSTP